MGKKDSVAPKMPDSLRPGAAVKDPPVETVPPIPPKEERVSRVKRDPQEKILAEMIALKASLERVNPGIFGLKAAQLSRQFASRLQITINQYKSLCKGEVK